MAKRVDMKTFTKYFFVFAFHRDPRDDPSYFRTWLRRFDMYNHQELRSVMDNKRWKVYNTLLGLIRYR